MSDTIAFENLEQVSELVNDGTLHLAADADAQWLLQSGYMVFFMQAGFAMLCAGSVRAKNAKNIILLNILDACCGSLCWWATGWAFAYGDNLNCNEGVCTLQNGNAARFSGSKYFFLNNLPSGDYASWFYQFTFAATAATIVSGAVAERTKFQAYLMYEGLLVLIVYPIVAHWVWSSTGWATAFPATINEETGETLSFLFGTGVYDFAGDGPVHMVGGFASMGAAYILGPRIGRFDADGNPVDMPGHNASLTLLGVFFLWFGWYGFNTGSTLAISGGTSDLAATVAINTTLGAATGALSTLFISYLVSYLQSGTYLYDLLQVGNGALGGLVAVTGGAGYIRPWAAFIVGIIGGFVYFGSSKLILNVMKIDDPVDAIAVHAFCGMWGLIGTAAFTAPEFAADSGAYGFIMGGKSSGGKLLAAALVYILAIAAWTLGITLPFFYAIKKLGQFRVDPEVEAAGLDVSHHGGSAYPHDPTSAKASMTINSEMIDRKIEEALAKAKLNA